jgi:hypothetical protein
MLALGGLPPGEPAADGWHMPLVVVGGLIGQELKKRATTRAPRLRQLRLGQSMDGGQELLIDLPLARQPYRWR